MFLPGKYSSQELPPTRNFLLPGKYSSQELPPTRNFLLPVELKCKTDSLWEFTLLIIIDHVYIHKLWTITIILIILIWPKTWKPNQERYNREFENVQMHLRGFCHKIMVPHWFQTDEEVACQWIMPRLLKIMISFMIMPCTSLILLLKKPTPSYLPKLKIRYQTRKTKTGFRSDVFIRYFTKSVI